MSNVIEFRPKSAAVSALDQVVAPVRAAILKELQAHNIERPDIAAAFAEKLKALLAAWDEQLALRFECDSELSDRTKASLEAGVTRLGAQAALAIATAFHHAAVTAVVASFDAA